VQVRRRFAGGVECDARWGTGQARLTRRPSGRGWEAPPGRFPRPKRLMLMLAGLATFLLVFAGASFFSEAQAHASQPVPGVFQAPSNIDSGRILFSVSCPSTTFCMAVDESGDALSWDGSSWSSPTNVDGSNYVFSVSCPSTTFCMAVDESGDALSWDGSSWSGPTSIAPGNVLVSVSCPTTSFCMAVGSGNVLSWNGSSWSSFPSGDGRP